MADTLTAYDTVQHRVVESIADAEGSMRTVGGIARDTGLPVDEVVGVIQSHPDIFIKSPLSPLGSPVYTIHHEIKEAIIGSHAVDRVYDDTTVSGLGHHTAATVGNTVVHPEGYVPGIKTGGHAIDGSGALDTRGIMEKTADTLTGDRIDDKTGRPV